MVKYKLRGFNYQNVELKNSHWERQRQDLIETYLSIENDDLLHYFRKLAGLHTHVNGLTGWYGQGASTFGQIIGAFSKLYLVTGDYRLKEKAINLLGEWGKCARSSFKVVDINDTYVYDKLMGGFLDAYQFLHCQDALEYVGIITDSAIRRFSTDIKRDGLQDQELFSKHMIEWYTLPENLYRAFQLTNNELYLRFAKEWDYTYLWEKILSQDSEIGPRHAYSHVNSLSSAAKAFEVTGDSKYLDVMIMFYKEVTENHMFATGGYGPAECLFIDNTGYLGDSLKDAFDQSKKNLVYKNFGDQIVGRSDTWGSCEISCCAWAVIKLCNYLIQFTGDARYGDWVERMLYNGLGGQLPITKQGKIMYYASYFIDGAIKSVEDRRLFANGSSFEWQCCTGTFPQDVAEYSNMLYYQSNDTLYISQYLPSKLIWKSNGSDIIIENYSIYPEEDLLKFRVLVNETAPCKFKLKFRVPLWATGKNEIMINGELMNSVCIAGEWFEIERFWSNEDHIQIHYMFKLRFTSVDRFNEDIVALSYGPIVLCTDKMTLLKGDKETPERWIHRVGDTLEFETEMGHVEGYDFLNRRFKPFYQVPEMEWYFLYNRICEE